MYYQFILARNND